MHGLALHAPGGAPGNGADRLFGLSLCSGAGGLDLGILLACPGYRALGYVEREAFAAAVLVARMEDAALDRAVVWDDVGTFDGLPWRGGVDILSAGYPCQPFSIAGKRRGADDPRHVWPHVARIIGECEPPFVFLENVISASDFPRSPETWSTWATGLRQASSRRRKSARPIGASGSSSSPTARVASTPIQPGFWPTPVAGDSKGTRNRTSGRTETTHRHHDGMTLCDATRLRMTPDTPGGGRSMPPGTSITGTTPDGRKVTVGLVNQARLWMTPTARDHKDGATSLANTPVNGLLGRQVLTTPTAGGDTSLERRSLNPLFVEALMGWPSGWTGFGSVATEWCRWLRLMRCELSHLSCWPIDDGATA